MKNKNDKEKHIVKHRCGSYQIMIWINGKNKYIGLYSTIEEAIIERDKALLKYNLVNTSRTNESHYVDNRDMMKEVIISKAMGKLSNNLLKHCMKIVKGVSKKFSYNDEEDRFDVEAYSYEVIIKNWHHFNEERYENPFAYYTEIIKRAFAMQFKILQKNRINTISLDWVNEEGKKIINI